MKPRSLAVAVGVLLTITLASLAQSRPEDVSSRQAMGSGQRLSMDLLARKSARRPLSTLVRLATPADRPELVKRFKATTDLARRRGLVWAMAYVGDAEEASLLRGMIAHDYGNRRITRPEEDVLADAVLALGFLAPRDAETRNLLASGVEPSFWSATRTWNSERGEYTTDLFVSYSIQAHGIAGGADNIELLDRLRQRSPNYLHRFAGDIAQASFYGYLTRTRGEEFLKANLVREDKELFEAWIATDEGSTWLEWANDKMRGPRPSAEDH